MRNVFHYSIMSLFCAALLVTGCTKTPLERFNDAVAQYKDSEEKAKALVQIRKSLLEYSSVAALKGKQIYHNATTAYTKTEGKYTILHPDSITCPCGKNNTLFFYDADTKRLACSDGRTITAFDRKGNNISEVVICEEQNVKKGKKKRRCNSVAALAIYKDNILFYHNRTLKSNLIQTESVKSFLGNNKFSPPFTRLSYKVYMERSGDLLGVTVGNVGMYNYSVIDMKKRDVLLTNKRIASMRNHLDGSMAYFITGKTGKWKLVQYSLYDKSTKVLASFRDILDIELFDKGCVVVRKDSLVLMRYDDMQSVPLVFPYVFKGRCCNGMLIGYNGTHVVADFEKLFNKLVYLKRKLPSLFTGEGDTNRDSSKKEGDAQGT